MKSNGRLSGDVMSEREQLIQEIEQIPDFLVREVLNFLLFIKTKLASKPEKIENISSENIQIPSFLKFIDQINAEIHNEPTLDLPRDFAKKLDHYLYGSPKE